MEQDNICISWKSLPWVLFEKKVFRLQCKIYEAKKINNLKLVKRLQKLLIQSKSSHFIATKVLLSSYENYKLSEQEKFTLANSIRGSLKEDCSLDKFRFFSSYKNLDFGKVLVSQYVLRFALEPLYFEKLEWISWKGAKGIPQSFKRFRSNIERLFNLGRKKVLRFEVDTCLMNVKYNLFMKQVSLPFKYKLFIYKSLAMQSNVKNNLVSFLTSIFVSDINNLYSVCTDPLVCQNNFNFGKFSFTYSNNIVYFLRYEDNFYDFIDKLKLFLNGRGLILKLSSIYISTLEEGFDFFSWFFKKRIAKKIFVSSSRSSWGYYKKLFKLVLSRNHASELKMKKITSLKINVIYRYWYIPKFRLRDKFYFVKKLIHKQGKALKHLQKKILFDSFTFKVF